MSIACEFYLKIDSVDITHLIAAGGVQWSRNDVEAPGSGRTMDGTMHRERVSTKIRLDISCRPLTTEETSMIQRLILPVYVTVEYLDLIDGPTVKTMYSNNVPAGIVLTRRDGTNMWGGVTFPLIER